EAATQQGRPAAPVEILTGQDGVVEVAGDGADVVLNGITGSIGLRPTLAALAAGSTLALANKESLIVGGTLVTGAARTGQIVPVDSEHSAIAQALRAGRAEEVRRLVLTASGGPFRRRPRSAPAAPSAHRQAQSEALIAGRTLLAGASRTGQADPVASTHSGSAQTGRARSAEEVPGVALNGTGGPAVGCGRTEMAQ